MRKYEDHHALAADRLEQSQNVLALAEANEERP